MIAAHKSEDQGALAGATVAGCDCKGSLRAIPLVSTTYAYDA